MVLSNLTIELDREVDGRWIAEVMELPGVLAYGATKDEAVTRVKSIAREVLDDLLKNADG